MKIMATWRAMLPGVLVAFLAAGADPPPVVDAARNAEEAVLRTLVEQGADVNATAADGSTALLWASHRDLPESVDLLIRAGADVNGQTTWGPRRCGRGRERQRGSGGAAAGGGADPNLALRHGETHLMATARSGNAGVAELLLEHGADPNATGPRGQTALMWAVLDQSSDVVKVLIDHGADADSRTAVTVELKAHEPHSHIQNQGWFEHGGNTAADVRGAGR